jgi:GxxExxY protein
MHGNENTETQRHRESLGVGRVCEAAAGPHAALTERIIGCAIEVHRELGPGLLESVYEAALRVELEHAGVRFRSQMPVPVVYRGRTIGEYRLDLFVEDSVVVEVKTAQRLDPVFDAQLLTYLRLTGARVGLLINFYSRVLKDGIRRLVL